MNLLDWYNSLLANLGQCHTAAEKIEFLHGVRTTTVFEGQLVAGLARRTEAVTINDPLEKAAAYAQAADLLSSIDHRIATVLAAEARAFAKVVKASNENDPIARARLWSETAVEFDQTATLAKNPQLSETHLLCAGWGHLARAFAAQALYQSGGTADLSELRVAAEDARHLFLEFGATKLVGLACSLIHYASAMEAKAAFEQDGNDSARIEVIKHMRTAAEQITSDEYAAIRHSYLDYADMVEDAFA
jgi:hypothetical protein